MAFLNEQGVERLWQHVVAKIEKSGGTTIPITAERPADLPANSLWFDIDEPTPEGSTSAGLPEIDDTPTEGSENLITSGAVYAAINAAIGAKIGGSY